LIDRNPEILSFSYTKQKIRHTLKELLKKIKVQYCIFIQINIQL